MVEQTARDAEQTVSERLDRIADLKPIVLISEAAVRAFGERQDLLYAVLHDHRWSKPNDRAALIFRQRKCAVFVNNVHSRTSCGSAAVPQSRMRQSGHLRRMSIRKAPGHATSHCVG